MTQAELLYSLPTTVTKNTYTTQACMSALAASAPVATIPGNFFGSVPNGVGRSLLLRAEGTIANTAAATFALALGLDTTPGTIANSITVMTATAPTAAITAPFHLEALFTCQAVGTSGGMTLQVNGFYEMEATASGGTGSASRLGCGFSASLTGLLATTQYYVELFGTWSASSASNTTSLQQMHLWGLN
jgi:hypothetical protein